ncbi:glioma pathogenesis-related protein 1-like isoform X1 [Alligator mississippiensis]|uniref:glioma pathogenesis-related protein 1-like isoform X1 n=1 Tax=Alligator mississippiensis TaxID=8496 RepID=UPI000712253E|nr:glioma pathogenesis-related protein 1-like isoform X1 [Alligator mississippiensis]
MIMKIILFLAVLSLLDLPFCSNKQDFPDIDNPQFIEDCVRSHNHFRSRVNPTASNMRRMSWDSALAKTARAWAKKCHFDHNIYLKVPGKVHPTFTPVGENIWTGSGLFSVNAALTDWYDEVNMYDFESRACTRVCGHYTQVVWAKSYKVGCAVQFCRRVTNFPGISNAAHFVCNYGPAGNYPTKPYTAGATCSQCNGEKCAGNLCENSEREQLINYDNWYPDWDTTPHLPFPRPPYPSTPSSPSPSVPSRSFCDQYCIVVLVLRLLFVFLVFGAVFLVQWQYPQLYIYE